VPHADAERQGYLHRYTEILAKDNPTFPDVDGDALALERQYRRLNLREVLRDWRAARKESLALLRRVKGGQWTRIGTHEILGPMSLETVLQRQAHGNDEAHLVQIENIKTRWQILSTLQETPKAVARSSAAPPTISRGASRPRTNGPCWKSSVICGMWSNFSWSDMERWPITTGRSSGRSIRRRWLRRSATRG